MTDDVTNPLGEEHLDNMNKALKLVEQARGLLNKAKLAGMDFSEHENTLKDLEAKARKYKSVFFPGR